MFSRFAELPAHMIGMTDTRVSAGVPTGGQYTAQNRTDSGVTLDSAGPRAVITVQRQTWEGDDAVSFGRPLSIDVTDIVTGLTPEVRAALSDKATTTDELYLAAQRVGITPVWDDPFHVDADEAIRDYFYETAVAYAAAHQCSGVEEPHVQVEMVVIELQDLARADIAADERRFELGLHATTIRVKEAFPTAARVGLDDDNEGVGSPFFVVSRIVDADGAELYARESKMDVASEKLSEFAPYLDRCLYRLDRFNGVYSFAV
jgi:hypothetical protein